MENSPRLFYSYVEDLYSLSRAGVQRLIEDRYFLNSWTLASDGTATRLTLSLIDMHTHRHSPDGVNRAEVTLPAYEVAFYEGIGAPPVITLDHWGASASSFYLHYLCAYTCGGLLTIDRLPQVVDPLDVLSLAVPKICIVHDFLVWRLKRGV